MKTLMIRGGAWSNPRAFPHSPLLPSRPAALLPLACFTVAALLLCYPSARAGASGLGTLRGTVLDAATGLPTACTVTLVDSTGKTVVENRSFMGGFRSNGRFEKQLPAGRTRVGVRRGFETHAVDRIVEIPAGDVVSIEIKLERVVDLRQRGWYGGDSHAHMIHGENTLPVDFDYIALAAQAEDLQYLSVAQAWTMEKPSPRKLEAALASRSTPDCQLTWNLEAPKNYYRGDAGRCLGHCWTLGLRGETPEHDNLIERLLNASAHDYESSKPTYANFESHRLVHDQGGAVFYSHPARWWMGSWGGQGGYPKQEQMRVSNMAVELPLDVLLGPTFDGVDLITGSGEFEFNAMAFDLWSLLLNHGYRVAGTASSDSCFDRVGGGTPGIVRTYTRVSGSFSLPKVTEAAANGHNFATSGPLLLASINGQPPGSSFPADGKSRTLNVEAWASGADPQGLSRLELLRDGRPILTNVFTPNVPSLQTNILLDPGKAGSWYCVRAFGSDPQRQRAISGAFFFEPRGFRPPKPAQLNVRARIFDAASGKPLAGTLTEITFAGSNGREGKRHKLGSGGTQLLVPGTARLRAEAKGYAPLTLSPILDSPEIVRTITGLTDKDLLNWATFERLQQQLSNVELVFRLEKQLR